METPTKPVLFYDQDCGFCRWSTDRIITWSRGRVEAASLQGPRADAALRHIDPARRMRSWHFVRPDGTVRSAGAAVPDLLEVLPGVGFMAPVARVFRWPLEGLYWLVARNRHRLSRLIGAQACAVDPGNPNGRHGAGGS